jgi:DNA repair protein RecN (Recombination protein N)
MLQELSIRQFAIIEEVHLHFTEGFHVFTGETGAGKSILIDALALIVGGRASTDFVRYGTDKAEIEAVFDISMRQELHLLLQAWGMEDPGDLLIIRREITTNGKNTCRINGRMIPLSMLNQIGKKLLDMSGQHEYQSLFHHEVHMEWLDQFGGTDVLTVRNDYEQIYKQVQHLKKEWTDRHQQQEERVKRIDWLKFQQEEIQSAGLVVDEDEELAQERNRFLYMEKRIQGSSEAYNLLCREQGGLDQIRQVLVRLKEITAVDDTVVPMQKIAQSAYYQWEEIGRELANYRDAIDSDPYRLSEIEERLHLIHQLKRKYGNTIADILAFGEKVTAELEQMSYDQEKSEELEKQWHQLHQHLVSKACQLTLLRKKTAKQLEKRIEQILADLHMENTRFQVSFTEEGNLSHRGQEDVSFQIAPNPGEPLRSLAKIASGGEASRILFALKVIFTNMEQIHTMVFDEVDAGVSGRTAQAIAEKMAVLSRDHQIFCITHLPQVACMADQHFYICKEMDPSQNITRAKVRLLTPSERILELARLLGGVEVTQKTCAHAEEMIRLAEESK